MIARLIGILLLGLVLVAYSPLASLSAAQSTASAQQMQQRALNELDRRINNLKDTQKKLATTVKLDNEKLTVSGSASTAAAQNNLDNTIQLAPELKTKSKNLIVKHITELIALRQQVDNASATTNMQSLGKSIDDRYQIDRLVNAQGLVLKTVESMTVVFDRLKSAQNSLQAQVTEIKQCADGDAQGCEGVGFGSGSVADSAQTQLDTITSYMSSIGSTVSSANAMLDPAIMMLTTLGSTGTSSANGSLAAVMAQLQAASGMSANAYETLKNTSKL